MVQQDKKTPRITLSALWEGSPEGDRGKLENLACDCIVSLEFVQSPLDVLAAQHFEVSHKEVGCLDKASLVKRGKLRKVEVVHFRHLN